MVKIRKEEQLDILAEEFGNAASKKTGTLANIQSSYDAEAKYDYTSITIRLNEYEAKIFDAAAKKAERKTLDWIRRTLRKAAESELKDN